MDKDSKPQASQIPDYLKSSNKFLNMTVQVEKVDNVHGSTAGAGSGDFHQYRQLRRKERYRLIKMEAESRAIKEVEEYEQRRKDMQLELDLKTQKKAMKRKMKKEKKKIIKEFKKDGEKFQPAQDGAFIDNVKQKYGNDVLRGEAQSESEESDRDNLNEEVKQNGSDNILGKRQQREEQSNQISDRELTEENHDPSYKDSSNNFKPKYKSQIIDEDKLENSSEQDEEDDDNDPDAAKIIIGRKI